MEIPAVLEQSLNSDLPGELKALITSNVYDTATGMYLLIPQGSRLIGKYDSRVSYGQNGVQVAWDRIIYPDASSVDRNGMVGLDSQQSPARAPLLGLPVTQRHLDFPYCIGIGSRDVVAVY
jgi:type IV secretory pathway VirB10-like protein